MSQDPAIPTFILRGHTAPVHALLFFSANGWLASGDSDGWLAIWSLASKRAAAVWKAHSGGVTGIKAWGRERLITHGRDHKLRVWRLNLDDPSVLSQTLPVEGATDDQAQPWLLHSMDMSALNFCTFAICEGQPAATEQTEPDVLIASPNGLDNGGIDIFQLPKERRVSQMHSDPAVNTGMVMSVALHAEASGSLYLICGFEDGQVGIYSHNGPLGPTGPEWKRRLLLKVHSQPVLSLAIGPARDFIITTSADAHIVKMPFRTAEIDAADAQRKPVDTKHAGQQGLSIRSDGKIFATAGWDSRVRVYSTKTMKELAVLKWHKAGCYSTAFADLTPLDNSVSAMDDTSEQTVAKSALEIIKQERSSKAQRTHWLVAGGKDGKISLWDIY